MTLSIALQVFWIEQIMLIAWVIRLFFFHTFIYPASMVHICNGPMIRGLSNHLLTNDQHQRVPKESNQRLHFSGSSYSLWTMVHRE